MAPSMYHHNNTTEYLNMIHSLSLFHNIMRNNNNNDLPEDYDEAEHHVNTALFAAERKKCLNKLSELGDKTLQTVHPNITLSSDSDSDVFTEESDGEVIEEVERN